MEYLSLLNEVVRDLEQDENSTRIKKLIFSTYKNGWENDLNKINNSKLLDLIQDLYQTYPTLADFKVGIYKIVNSLNKKAEYALIANIIIDRIDKLYSNTEDSTQVVSTPSDHPSFSVSTPNQQPPNSTPASKKNEEQKTYDPFELRLEIIKYTNPLRAKILLFSILEHKFDFSTQDWLKIKARELDSLVLDIFKIYETLTELEFRLENTAKHLYEPDEHIQAASAIVKAMAPFYVNRKPTENSLDKETMAIDFAEIQKMNLEHISNNEDSTCQFL